MKINYHPETDSLYIHLADKPGADTHVLSDVVVMDVDEDGRPVGFEIQGASSLVDVSQLELEGFPLTNLLLREAIPT